MDKQSEAERLKREMWAPEPGSPMDKRTQPNETQGERIPDDLKGEPGTEERVLLNLDHVQRQYLLRSDGDAFVVNVLLAEITRLQSTAKRESWINVEDGLPEYRQAGERKWYLVSDGERMDFALYLRGATADKGSFMGRSIQFSDVKFWQEPPDPPTMK